MSGLQLLWFCLICLIFCIYFFLEGFDYGVGMSLRFLARDRRERNELVDSIDPVWEANQVWLVIAGGVMFATFPIWYGTFFSGLYLFFLFILAGLIIRGAAINVRTMVTSQKAQDFWDFIFFLGSIMVPFLFGALFVSLMQGIPIAQDGSTASTFLNYVGYSQLIGGATLALLCLLHGLSYISMKFEGDLRARATRMARWLYPSLFVLLVAFAWLTNTDTDFFKSRTVTSLLLLVVLVVVAALSAKFTFDRKSGLAFIFNGLTLASVVIFVFNGLFPRVLISSTNPKFSILIENASSAPNTLSLITGIACVLLPVLILYQIWTYRRINRRGVARADSAQAPMTQEPSQNREDRAHT